MYIKGKMKQKISQIKVLRGFKGRDIFENDKRHFFRELLKKLLLNSNLVFFGKGLLFDQIVAILLNFYKYL